MESPQRRAGGSLLTLNNRKTTKGEARGWLTAIQYLAPHTLAGGPSVCPYSTPDCRAGCLYTAGRGAFNNVQQARIARTRSWHANPAEHVARLVAEITLLKIFATSQNMNLACRLNGTSDIPFEDYGIMEMFPGTSFYDYTKVRWRLDRDLPPNYALIYSVAEWSPRIVVFAADVLKRGGRVSCVVTRGAKRALLASGAPFIDGDADDLRFLDPPGSIVLLEPKGKIRGVAEGVGMVLARHDVATLALEGAGVTHD